MKDQANLEFRGIDPESLVRNFQTQRTEHVETMLRQHGFEFKGQEGSHRKWSHPSLTRPLIIVNNSKLPVYQQTAAKACLRIRELARQQHEAATQPPVIPLLVSRPDNGILNTIEAIPAHVSASKSNEIDHGIVLRLKDAPYIGCIVGEKISEAQLSAVVRGMEEEERVFAEELKLGMEMYELQTGTMDGCLSITQPTYRITFVISPYEDAPALRILTLLINLAEREDSRYLDILEDLLKTFKEENAATFEPQEDGNILWRITRTHFLTNEPWTYKLTTSSGWRVSTESLTNFWKTANLRDYAWDGDTGFIKRTLNKHYGFKVKQDEREGGKNFLVASHPYFPSLDFEIEDPRPYIAYIKAVQVKDVIDELETGVPEEQYPGVDERKIHRTLADMKDKFDQLILENCTRNRACFEKAKRLGVISHDSYGKIKPGEEYALNFVNKTHGMNLRVKFMGLAGKKVLCNPADLFKLEQELNRVEAAVQLSQPQQTPQL